MNWYLKGLYSTGVLRFEYWWSLAGWKNSFDRAHPFNSKKDAEGEIPDALAAYSGIQIEVVQR